jgi:hypothetical protein
MQSTLVSGGAWPAWPDSRLLDVRLCDLPLKIQGTAVGDQVIQLHHELDYHRLLFRPHFWLSNEWFCPDGVPGIAVPFYLAHPRLARLEQRHMLEVEGGTPAWCLRILRHEAGHAIENAYRLRLRRRRRELFGSTTEDYPDFYRPRPHSKSYVQHLDQWYAQSHPDEDFAETFAVWLNPESRWRERYAGWPAMKKLTYMDELMTELAGVKPLVTTREEIDPLRELTQTLREHYEQKREHYGLTHAPSYDADLRRLFSASAAGTAAPTAATFLMRIRREARRDVARWTGEYQYTIDQVLQRMIDRCRELKLRLAKSESESKRDFTILLTVQTMNHLLSGRHRVAL